MKQIPQPNLYKTVLLSAVAIPFIGVLIAGAFVWNRYVFPSDITLFVALYFLTGLGVTIGYHRMLTHQSFETIRPLKGLLLILGCMAFEGPPITWAATHIHHHANSDHDGDPHSPLKGFWHAHFWWMIRDEHEDPAVYAPHLFNDPVAIFVGRYAWLWMVLSLLIPFLIGGFTGFIWGGLVRIFFVNHATWSVNSICHTFGRRPFEANDESRNEWIIGLVAHGEGWHNNHHAFPQSAFHGLRWWQYDLSGLVIRALEQCGLVWNVQRVSKELMEGKLKKGASMREAIAELKEQLGIAITQAQSDLSQYVARLKKEHELLTQQGSLFEPTTLFNVSERFHSSYEEAVRHLEKMRRTIEKRKSMRKTRAEEYRAEIHAFVTASKRNLRQQIKKLAPASA
jgi:stearoyl-CoA desaturase (Delta-9 desaturase)